MSTERYLVKHGLTKQCTPWYQVNGKFVSREVWLNAINLNALDKALYHEARKVKLYLVGVAVCLIGVGLTLW